MREDAEVRGSIFVPLYSLDCCFSCLSPTADVGVPKSKAVPGVFGVLADKPKEANAPDPSPKADDAPVEGDVTLVVARGVMPLRGLVLLLNESKRLAGWYVLDPPFLLSSLGPPLVLEMDVLLELDGISRF